MNEPWFDPNAWAWLPGTLFGCSLGLWGSLAGALGPQGKARRLVLGTALLLVALAATLLTAGLVALRAGQPYGVWFFLALPGAIGLSVMGPLLPLVLTRYRQAEERKIAAEDLRV